MSNSAKSHGNPLQPRGDTRPVPKSYLYLSASWLQSCTFQKYKYVRSLPPKVQIRRDTRLKTLQSEPSTAPPLHPTISSTRKVSKMKLAFNVLFGQSLLASSIFVTATTLPELQERAPTNEALNSTAADLQAMAAPCTLRAHYAGSWKEGVWQRRRVKGTSEGSGGGFSSTRDMLNRWCDSFWGRSKLWKRRVAVSGILIRVLIRNQNSSYPRGHCAV